MRILVAALSLLLITACAKTYTSPYDDPTFIPGLDEPLDPEAVEILDNASVPVPRLDELVDDEGNQMFPDGKITEPPPKQKSYSSSSLPF
jgi:hypothetical protein